MPLLECYDWLLVILRNNSMIGLTFKMGAFITYLEIVKSYNGKRTQTYRNSELVFVAEESNLDFGADSSSSSTRSL